MINDQENLRVYVVSLLAKFGYTPEDYENKEKELGEEQMRQVEKIVCLRAIDTLWIEHLENMEYLRDSVRLRAYGQQDPLVEYKNEGHRMFRGLLESIDSLIADSLMRVRLVPSSSVQSITPTPPVQRVPSFVKTSEGKKVGRNDPCPCGSGKKWKRCGMINAPDHKQ